MAALVLLLSTAGGGFGRAPCPHHGASDAAHGGSAQAGAAHHHGAHASGDQDSGEEPPRGEACTCVGTCQPAGGAALPAATQAGARAADLPGGTGAVPSAAAPRPRHPPFFLPYGLAPPAHG